MSSDRDMSSGRTSGALSRQSPLARWNPSRDCWETDHVDLLSGLSDVWSETWPTSGTWADGSVYASPTWADAMAGSASSSSPVLPTPTATYSGNTPENHLRKKPGRSKVTDLRILVEDVGL